MREHQPSTHVPPLSALLAGQLSYQMRVLLRTPRAVVGGMLLPVLLLLLRQGGDQAPTLEKARLIAGLCAFGLLSTAYITHTGGLVSAREGGVLKRWRAMPVPAWCYFTGRIGATVVLAAAGAIVTAIAGTTAYGIPLHLAAAASLAGIALLGAAAWTSIGIAASGLIPTAEAAWPLLAVSYLPIVILSGGFGPVHGEPAWLSTLVGYLPAQPIVDGASRALGATSHGAAMATPRDLAVLGGMDRHRAAVVAALVSVGTTVGKVSPHLTPAPGVVSPRSA